MLAHVRSYQLRFRLPEYGYRRVIEATQDKMKLNDDTIILTNTIIWSAGVAPSGKHRRR